jgi:hypothetical protein
MSFKKLFRIGADSNDVEKLQQDANEQVKQQAIELTEYLYNYDELFRTRLQANKHITARVNAIKNRFNLIAEKVDLSSVIFIDENTSDYCECSKCGENLWSDDIQHHNCD